MLFGVGAKPVLGLDIGSSSIKIVELEKKRSGFVMKAFSSIALPEDAIIDGDIINHAAVVDAIKAAVKESAASAKQASSSVAGASVIIKHIAIPKTQPKDVEDQVYFEAEQYIPFDMTEISLDFQIVQEDMGDGKMDILLVAAKKDFIEKRLSAVREGGLEPEILDVDSLALANIYWENYEHQPDTAALLIDVGAALTKINIVSENSTLFTRDVAIGGKNLTTEIQNKMNVSFQEAEGLKVDACLSGQIPQEMTSIVASIVENISLEIRRSLDFFLAASTPYHVSSVYLSGGSCRIIGLKEALEEIIGIPAEYLNPFNKITASGKEFNEEFLAAISSSVAIPMGLALRTAD